MIKVLHSKWMSLYQEQAIRAVVSDCAYADIVPILEREVPKGGHLPALFTPGTLFAARVLYGVDFYCTYAKASESLATRRCIGSGPWGVASFGVYCAGCAITCDPGDRVASESCAVRRYYYVYGCASRI